jgi:hypothetical protein
LCAFVALAGCDVIFPLTTPSAVPANDAPVPDTFVPDARRCFGTIQLCFNNPPMAPLVFDGVTEVNTDNDPACTDQGENGWCVIAATQIQVNGTLRGIGTKPLVLVAGEIVVSGVIDVASHPGDPGAGANATVCDLGGGASTFAGGSGGSFAARGGNGGIATGSGVARSVSGLAATTFDVLRGGCRGNAGGSGTATVEVRRVMEAARCS